jgi:undecaprenyl diphosphate synthase
MADDVDALSMARDRLPRHVAIVMDGNGRWAQQRALPRTAGHREGAKAVRRVVEACAERGIEVLTLFAFSSENWRRPRPEVEILMNLFVRTLRSEIRRLDVANVRIRFIGDIQAFSPTLQDYMVKAEQRTAGNTGLTLVIAVNYGGRWDVAQAARRLAEEVAAGRWQPADVTPETFHRYTCLADLPEPDLFIRTGGEQRISNFLLWQLAYTELYFSERLWPDYTADDLDAACAAFASRQRRFGQTGEQVTQGMPDEHA